MTPLTSQPVNAQGAVGAATALAKSLSNSSSIPAVPAKSIEPDQITELPQLRQCRRFVQGSSFISVLVGALAMFGWLLHVPIFTHVFPGFATMKPNTAVCFVLVGLGVWLLQNPAEPRVIRARAGFAAVSLATVTGVVTIVEYWPGVNFDIDELLVWQELSATATSHPGRMSLATATGITALGLSLLLVNRGPRWIAVRQALSLLAALDGMIAVVGHIYGVDALYAVSPFSSMALHTSVLLMLLGLGSLALRPRTGIMGIITSEFLGGMMARWVLPLAIVLPLLLGWIRWRGELAGYYGTQFGLTIFTLSNVCMLSTLLLISASAVNHADEKRRRAEVADLWLASIVESSLDAIVGKDLDDTVVSWNRSAESLYGYTATEMVGRPITRLIPPHLLHEEVELLHSIRSGKCIESFETQRIRKDGKTIDVAITMSPVKDCDGNVIGVSKSARDITARKQTEITLQASHAAREQALKELADQKFALDQHAIVAITDVQGTITYANEKFCAISKYSRDELIGQNHRILNSGHHPREFFRDMYRTISAGKVWRGEIRNRAKDGSHYWVDTTIVPALNADEKPRQYVAIRADITGRKQAEIDLQRQADDLARSNGDLQQFAYAASHDLQEPSRAVTGCMQLFRAHYGGQIDQRADELITHAVDGATRMQKLIEDLLSFSRVGTSAIELQSVECSKAVENALKNLSFLLHEQAGEVQQGQLPVVLGDLSQLTLLFQNLIGNALKFHGPEPPRIHISARQEGKEWVVAVRDNGIGIDPQYHARIFVIFQRLHTRKEYPGTGMGLALCKRIVERHGGRIWVESDIGKGTTFCFTLCTQSGCQPG